MTDTELKRREAICDVAGIDDIGELSDGSHTFNSLYEQRMILFAALVKAYKGKAWKSYRHEDGEYCFGGGWFIVGIDTPEGSYTYHYENKYWDMFDCADLPRAKHWDGHTEADAETRLMSLEPENVMSELKPCPFCGRSHGLLIASIHNRLDDITFEQWSVFCDASGDKVGCGASCGYHKTKVEAIEAWNRRAERRES